MSIKKRKQKKLPVFRPMAASTAKDDDEAWSNPDWIADEKLNGFRQLFYRGYKTMRFVSRRISVKNGKLVDKTDRLLHLCRAFKNLSYGTILDGELIAPDEVIKKARAAKEVHPGSKYMTHVLGSLPPRAKEIQKSDGPIRYIVFDILFYQFKDVRGKSLRYRRKLLEKVLLEETSSPYVSMVRFVREKPDKNGLLVVRKYPFYHNIVKAGGEGIILKNLNSTYKAVNLDSHEYRSPDWKKVKSFGTWEMVIVGFTRPRPTTIKTDGTESANRNAANKWISGVVIGQYVLMKDIDERATADLLSRYHKRHKTYNEVLEFCKSNRIKVDGKKYMLQPYGVTLGMNDQQRRLISKYKKNYLGSVVEIIANARDTKNRRFQHSRIARFREDKPKELCIYREDEK